MIGFHNAPILKFGAMSDYWSGCGKRDTTTRAAVRLAKQVVAVRSARDVQIETLLRKGELVEEFLINVRKFL